MPSAVYIWIFGGIGSTFSDSVPMRELWGRCMQITVELPPNVMREAELRGKPAAAFAQQLLELGLVALNAQARRDSNEQDVALPESELLGSSPRDPSVVQSAMERIRALHGAPGLHASGLNPAHRG